MISYIVKCGDISIVLIFSIVGNVKLVRVPPNSLPSLIQVLLEESLPLTLNACCRMFAEAPKGSSPVK